VTWPLLTATDNCSGPVTVTVANPAYASGNIFPVGTTSVVVNATDVAGNVTTCSFTITVMDDVPPSITCPSNITTTAQANTCGAIVNYAMPTATDNCTGTTVTRTAGPASGSFFPVGTTTVTHRATDMGGNSVDCSFTVTVSDAQAPVMACPVSIVTNAQPGSCGAIVNYTTPTGSDNCGAVTVTRTAGPASGSMFPVGSTTVTHHGTDMAGNSSDCFLHVFNIRFDFRCLQAKCTVNIYN